MQITVPCYLMCIKIPYILEKQTWLRGFREENPTNQSIFFTGGCPKVFARLWIFERCHKIRFTVPCYLMCIKIPQIDEKKTWLKGFWEDNPTNNEISFTANRPKVFARLWIFERCHKIRFTVPCYLISNKIRLILEKQTW